MTFGYTSGRQLPDRPLKPRLNSSFTGAPIGILLAEARYPMPPGNVANASTYDFPVIFHVLKGVPFELVVAGDPSVLPALIAGGKELVANGVRAVVGACGSFANYQRATASALPVPVFLSSMLQVPWIQPSLMSDQKILVISAVRKALTQRVFDECGIDKSTRLLIEQAIDVPEFEQMLSPEGFNPKQLERELVHYTTRLVEQHAEAGAILLQCSDLPPFAWAIQNATGLPVFDMNTLIDWVHTAVVRTPYDGLI